MRILRNIFASWGRIDRCRYSRSVMAQLYFPKDSVTDVFVARIPVDEGVNSCEDFDIVINSDIKELVIIAKRKPTIKIDGSPSSSPIHSSSLEPAALSASVMESHIS